MDPKSFGRKKTCRKTENKERAATIAAVVSSVICCLLLSLTVIDCEKYAREDSVSAAITFTPPEKQEEAGFWDIFAETVVRLFVTEG